jgi:hypothetical protein
MNALLDYIEFLRLHRHGVLLWTGNILHPVVVTIFWFTPPTVSQLMSVPSFDWLWDHNIRRHNIGRFIINVLFVVCSWRGWWFLYVALYKYLPCVIVSCMNDFFGFCVYCRVLNAMWKLYIKQSIVQYMSYEVVSLLACFHMIYVICRSPGYCMTTLSSSSSCVVSPVLWSQKSLSYFSWVDSCSSMSWSYSVVGSVEYGMGYLHITKIPAKNQQTAAIQSVWEP